MQGRVSADPIWFDQTAERSHPYKTFKAIPADVLGLADRGRIAPGMRADLVALDPESLAVRAVWLGGELAVGPAELR